MTSCTPLCTPSATDTPGAGPGMVALASRRPSGRCAGRFTSSPAFYPAEIGTAAPVRVPGDRPGLSDMELPAHRRASTDALRKGNEIAAMYRVSTALMRVGRTEHTIGLARNALRLTG